MHVDHRTATVLAKVYSITKEFAFEAAHHLEGLPPEHQCSRVHGHSYKVVVELEATALDETGFVLDYGKLKMFETWLKANCDHRDLNEQLDMNPTAENLAKHFFEAAQDFFGYSVSGVMVKETDKTSATYCK